MTVDAIRSRIKRGTIEHVREEGRVYVIIGGDQVETSTDQVNNQDSAQYIDQESLPDDRDELVEELRSRVRALEEANRKNRRLLAAALHRFFFGP